jgi:hypothetical protein
MLTPAGMRNLSEKIKNSITDKKQTFGLFKSEIHESDYLLFTEILENDGFEVVDDRDGLYHIGIL